MPYSDNGPLDRETRSSPSPFLRFASMALAMVVGVFALGFILGVGMAVVEEGSLDTPGAALIGGAMIVLAGSAWVFRRMAIAGRDEPVSASVRRSNRLTWISAIVGVGLALFMTLGSEIIGAPFDLYTNDPVSASIAAIAIAVWLPIVPAITWRWYQAIDEHALQAYNFGALVALHLFVVAAPVWWLGWRGGFLPEPDIMLLYIAVLVVWCLAWSWRRYR